MAISKAEKVVRIGRILDELYSKQPIPLDHSSGYTLLVAVMLSAQTTDKKVNQVTPFLFKKASTPAQMAELEVAEIQEIIREIGLAPTKAKNLAKMATQLLNNFQGEIPNNFEGLESLAGVGHKTASVVMVQWFGVDAFPVDTHIHRLAARWGLSNGQNVTRTERDLKRCFDESEWRRRHLQIIFFGREYCQARGHNLTTCPICSFAASKARIKAEAKRY
jgi:endonuclease-3